METREPPFPEERFGSCVDKDSEANEDRRRRGGDLGHGRVQLGHMQPRWDEDGRCAGGRVRREERQIAGQERCGGRGCWGVRRLLGCLVM